MPTVLLKATSPNENDLKFDVEVSRVLFDECERLGTSLPHGCLAGSCGSCRIEILEGADNLSPPGAVEADTISSLANNYLGQDKIIRLSCRAKVLGDVSFRLLK